MEDTLGVFLSVATQPIFSVLILVLMEDTLGAELYYVARDIAVLILVLMEDTLGELGA